MHLDSKYSILSVDGILQPFSHDHTYLIHFNFYINFLLTNLPTGFKFVI